MNRLTLAGLLVASGSLVACGGATTPQTTADAAPDMMVTTDGDMPDTSMMDGGGQDGGTDARADGGTDARTDTATDVRADAADAGMTCGRLPYTTIMRAASGPTTVRGDTTMAWMSQTGGMPSSTSQVVRPPSGSRTCVAMTGQLAYSYTIGSAAAALNVSTTNMGTPRNFDTVVYITTRCANTLSAAACNDDDPRYAAAADRRVSSYVTTEVLPAGTQVFIIIGGFYPPGDGMVTTDHGAFEMTISELPGVADGGACDPSGLTNRCNAVMAGATPLVCVPDAIGAAMGHCRTQGSVAGSGCRDSEPRCDMGLTCSAAAGTTGGVCQRAGMADMACDAYTRCPDGYECNNTTLGFVTGVCRRVGSSLGSSCRPMGAMGGRCDAPLVCSVDIDSTDTTPSCVRAATLGGACDIFRSVCPMGSTCVTPNGGATLGTCTADGAGARARCRATGTRCDMGLSCIVVGDGGDELCLTPSMTNMACGPARQCPDGNTCYLTDLTDRQNGLCGATGQAGGQCRMGATMLCDGTTQCSRADGNGICSNVSTMMGAACDRLRTRCGTGLSCVLTAGSLTMGTCQPDGSVAGADCRAGDMPCATGLTCTGSALSGGTCASTAMAGGACTPVLGTSICPMGQYCLASSFTAGTCNAMTTAEMEPNNNPNDVTMRAAAAPTLYRGTLERFDVDCYAVTVPAMGRITAVVSDGNGHCPVNIGGRLAMDVYSSDGTTVRGITQQNGPFGAGSCAHVDGGRSALYPWAASLTAGTYYVCIRGVQDAANNVTTERVENYVLSLAAAAGM